MRDQAVMAMWSILLILLVLCTQENVSELTPPYFNLAEGRQIFSTATCGVDSDGPELFCKLVGANTENDHSHSLIQGQVCDYCDLSQSEKSHPPEYAIDGSELWWQSPPLSRGMKYNEVNLTINFGQEFHVAYLFIRMGNSPRPGLWTLEKSSDYGKTWKAWQHFSDTPADCEIFFGKDSLRPITRDDDVICTTEYSKIVPLENGEIPVMLLNNRPSANNYFNSTTLQEWTRATNVRFRFLRTKNLLGHLMSVARQDPTVTRRYFYSIKDISIGGRCMCNGHADTCHVLDPKSPVRILACQCRHNTCGIQCNTCCPGYEQKKWHQNTNAHPFQCEPCNCFGHSGTCVYDEEVDRNGLSLDINGHYEGGGVCGNCQHNTEGINCNKCKSKFYRPYGKHLNETDVCQPCNCDYVYSTGNCAEETGKCECRVEYKAPNCDSCEYGYYGYPDCKPCDCNLNGTDGYYCEATDGRCPCKHNFDGDYCNHCSEGFYGLPDCKQCDCNGIGSVNDVCDFESGQCTCQSSFAGQHCDICKDGYFAYPECKYCNCDISGTLKEVCDKDLGKCLCKEGFGGPRCDQCLPGYYNYPNCESCNCSIIGSVSEVCDATGKCPCLQSFAGKQCTLCSTGYYDYPQCSPCNCDNYGSNGISCNSEGQCQCEHNFDGKTCNQCKESFYNFPACEDCNCDPSGVIARFAGCGSVPAGELCQCKERVTGRICNQCKSLYWNLNATNPLGCEECNCEADGTIAALDTCESKSGQCACKPFVQGRDCNECKDGTFDLYGSSLFGCKDCGCDIGGSASDICDKLTGQCKCHNRVTGRTCTHPLTTHYFPTLYQNQFEYEDGYSPSGALVRYQFDEAVFPEFSKKGYAVFSGVQKEVINEVTIFKSSVYRMVIRFVNRGLDPVVANILITSENPSEVDQTTKVFFRPAIVPEFVTVSGAKGEIPYPMVLDPGRYTISIKSDKALFLDYFVLLPAAYYEAGILTRKIQNPCEVDNLGLCKHFKYPSIEEYAPAMHPHITQGDTTLGITRYYEDQQHLHIIGEDRLPSLIDTPKLHYIVDVPKPGKYIVVVDYITDRNSSEVANIWVNVADDEEQDGVVTLYPCKFTTVCRQPVVDKDSREKEFLLDNGVDPLVVLTILSEDSPAAAIKSVTAIPYEEWSIDFIRPKQVCVMLNGKCVRTTYRPAPDSKKIEVVHDDRHLAKVLPDNIFENATRLVYLDVVNSTIEIKTKVPEAGRYVVLVQYYQPKHPKFNVNYALNNGKQTYNGKLPVLNCPSNSGCRQIITQDTGYLWFDIEDEATLTLTNNLPTGVWFEYIVLVPAEYYSDKLLEEETFDETKQFIKECGQNHFHIQLNATEFCRQAVFSLTADYNSGSLSCNCDYYGSNSFECDPFGGQCQCKPNIIGRQCEACRTGFYGFPDCKKCECPSTAQCEKDTGECICPPRVTGEKCDQCKPYTFGFDQIIGCEDCSCNPMGVQNGDLQCDLNNGTCDCRTNIEGRICDKCINGYFNFPHCEKCRCNTIGTTFDICNQEDESCYCKKNVQGRHCEYCVDGTYNMRESNPLGCTKCFCFGKTSRCESAFLKAFNVSMLNYVSVNTIIIDKKEAQIIRWQKSPMINETTLLIEFSDSDTDEDLVYFGVLDHLLDQNNHLSAYGGVLTYSLYYTTGPFGKARFGPDVVLEGKDLVIIHTSYEQPANAQAFKGIVNMVEDSFTTISGAPVSRDQFMMLLKDLTAIYIRSTYWEQTVLSSVSDVYLTMADEDIDNDDLYEELSVEKCFCPPGYEGLSCENCAKGYYRDPNGPHGGYCVPCNCNGHADSCDCNTGVCFDCEHFTTGEHCEKCIEGYNGNATLGNPNDCMICACPIPITSNNFATGCEVSGDGYRIHCTCKPGYAGERCQSCSAGFYGEPEIQDDYCKPCECSGNINTDDENSCDSVSGECLRCLNNTSGTACNYCATGFYGDAVKLKDCQSCNCDEKGTKECDKFIGTCECWENVVGSKCDRCEDDHYGFSSGHGCSPCDCAVASNSTQCEYNTGECHCMPGVGGRQCDKCLPGYWNYTSNGCQPCSCNTDYSRGLGCNALNGQCECLPGVIGEKCDSCPYRWVLIEDSGCQECDICHHALLDVTDSLRNELDPVVHDFQTIASGYFTAQKLIFFNESVDMLEPLVKALDPTGVNLNPQRHEVDSLEMDIKNLDRRISYLDQNANEASINADKLLSDASNIRDNNRLVHNTVKLTILEVEKLADSFDSSQNTKADKAIQEAQEYLKDLLSVNYDDINPVEQLSRTLKLQDQILTLNQPTLDQNMELDALKLDIGEFSDKIEDLVEWSQQANNKSQEAKKLHHKNKEASLNLKFDTVVNQTKETMNNINATAKLSKDGIFISGEIFAKMHQVDTLTNEIDEYNNEFENILPATLDEYNALETQITDAEIHANTLAAEAEDLIEQYSNITASSETAIRAATAYSDIVDSVNNARGAVRNAGYSAGNATELCEGIEERAGESDQIARELLRDAKQALSSAQTDLRPHLNSSTELVKQINNMNQNSDDQTTAINNSLDSIPVEEQSDIWLNAKKRATDAQKQAEDALTILKPIVNELPLAVVQSKQLPNKVDMANTDIAQTSNQVDRVKHLIPEIDKLVNELSLKQDQISIITSDLGERINNLKENIVLARQIANRINVGVTFLPNTILELKPPENLHLMEPHSRVSTYFKTDNADGLLFYLGNEANSGPQRGKRDDFMSLVVENGYPVLTIDLGEGTPERIISRKFVQTGEWYQAIVERTGKQVELIIREELRDGSEQLHEEKHQLVQNGSLFNLDENSKLFVGGIPPDFNIQDEVKHSSFVGQIEGLKVGESDVGLWNFVDGQDNTNGAMERDVLLRSEKATTGYKFAGNGYVVLDSKAFSFKQKSTIQFRFKANRDTTDGLLFYAGKNRHFIAVEMRDGGIYFKYKLGQHMVSIGAEKQLNDNEWHKVEAARDGRRGDLKVDDNLIYQEETPAGTEENLKTTDNVYFGGFPGKLNHTEITHKGFDGCIDDVYIFGTPIDLSQNVKTQGTRPGCPIKFSGEISYPPQKFGYLRQGNVSSSDHFVINMKFKSTQNDGILFFATNNDQSATISLTLFNGNLVLRSMKEELATGKTYADGRWYSVTATHRVGHLELAVDYADFYTSDSSPPALHISHGDIYFGGLPKGFKTVRGSLATNAYFMGCIKDVRLNGRLVNFAESNDRQSVVLDNCARDVFDHPTVPIFYPDSDVKPITDVHTYKPNEGANEIDKSANEDEEEEEERRRAEEDMQRQNEKDAEKRRKDESEREEIKRRLKYEEELERQKELERQEELRKQEEIAKASVRTTTISTPTTKYKLPPPVPVTECRLPVKPEVNTNVDLFGYRFGTASNSYIEYNETNITKIKKSYDLALQFKTDEPNGLLFYAADARHTDYIGLFLKDGKIHHVFKCGNGTAEIISDNRYDDGNWHTVLFSRQNANGKLAVDSQDDNVEKASGIIRSTNLQSPFYAGGIPFTESEDALLNVKMSSETSFNGCIRNVMMAGHSLERPKTTFGVIPCSDEVEKGVFFGKGGGYVKLRDRFKVGTDMTFEFDIKPRTRNGLLLSVHGKKSMLTIHLVNGTIVFTDDSGNGPVRAIFAPKPDENFCDGEWRTITAVKSSYVITISVNGLSSEPGIGQTASGSTDTSRPLFIGGHPHLEKSRGLKMRKPYLGCIRNFKIKDVLVPIIASQAAGDVSTGVCSVI